MHQPKPTHHQVLKDQRPHKSHPHNRHIRSQIWQGDFRERLQALPAGSVDCVVTDPPYGVTDLAYDKEKLDVAAMWGELDRIAKPEAMVIVFTCQPFTTDVVKERSKAFRYELIWSKNTVTGFLSAKRRPLRSHENILVFCRTYRGSTYNPQMETGKPYRTSDTGGAALYRKHRRIASVNHGTRYPRSVRFAASVSKGRLHPSEKPIDLLSWLILMFSNPGDLVCDPFMGSASTGQACLDNGRRFIGVEKDPEFYQRARGRLMGQ